MEGHQIRSKTSQGWWSRDGQVKTMRRRNACVLAENEMRHSTLLPSKVGNQKAQLAPLSANKLGSFPFHSAVTIADLQLLLVALQSLFSSARRCRESIFHATHYWQPCLESFHNSLMV